MTTRQPPYDNYVAGIRTVIFVSYMVTNIAIIANAVRHWDDVKTGTGVATPFILCYTNYINTRDKCLSPKRSPLINWSSTCKIL